MSRPTRKAHDKSSDAGEVPSSPWRGKVAGIKLKKEKSYDRSQYMYENKQNKDNMTGEMTDIYANSTHISQKIRDLEGQFAVNCAFRTLLEFQNQQRAVSVEYRA
jgi:hypothetical protein